jgi:retinol dehydrogenase 14
MQGKICMVTGANSGIGKATALGLAKMGATVVMVCRDRNRGEVALNDIKRESGSAALELMVADLSSQESIHRLAADYKRTHSRLHVLINNAAVNRSAFMNTVDGIEMTFAVNHLAPFLLTHLLLDVLKASAPARIVNVASNDQSPINFDDLMGTKQSATRAYSQSKMANVLFTYQLARKLQGTGVTVNCVHPGLISTNLGRDFKGLFGLLIGGMRPFMAAPDKGAETPVFLASSGEVEGITGKYFANKKQRQSAKESYDETTARRLWQISAELTKLESIAV